MNSSNSRKMFSCWDEVDPEELECVDYIEDRIYVHREILEWIVDIINDEILSVKLRATVEEVHHHNLDGPVFLIKFYQHKTDSKSYPHTPEFRKYITTLKDWLKFKMPWQKNKTYFLRIDSRFEVQKIQIMERLQQLCVLEFLTITALDVNWLYIPKIEIYEFSADLSEALINEIESIFEERSGCPASLYMCDQFKWHNMRFLYTDMDTLAMDICAEEWRRLDFLKDFRVSDILNLELANKDYRDPYYNEYLDRYLNILLKKIFPQLFSEQEETFIFSVYRLVPHLRHYFVSRFINKLSVLCDKVERYDDLVTLYDIPNIKRKNDKVVLEEDQPSPHTILMMESHVIEYTISNYNYFGDGLLQAMLNKSNECQMYHIKFDKDFIFAYDNIEYSHDLTSDCNYTAGVKNIIIGLEHCTESNAVSLSNFVKYLFKLFTGRHKLEVEVAFSFSNCLLDDYSFLEHIESCIRDVQFQRMNFSSHQLNIISRALSRQRRRVDFVDCEGMTDTSVMILLEYIDFDDLRIDGSNICTPLVFYLMAEHLMVKEGIDLIEGNRLFHNMEDCSKEFYFDFDVVEFVKVNFENDVKMIIARNRSTKETVDLYNHAQEDESFDKSYNIYSE